MSLISRITLISAITLGGCTATPEEPAARPPSPTAPSTSSSTAAADDPPGLITCRELATAVGDATLMDPGVIDRIAAASGTADAPVADAAQRLAEAYAKAVAARGSENEPDAVAAVSAAAVEMSQVCADSGLASAD